MKETKDYSVKEVAGILNLEVDTIYQYILRGKIKSMKGKNGRHRISEKNLELYKQEEAKFIEEIKDHYSTEELEMIGLHKELVIGGTLESKKVRGRYYVHFEEVKRFFKLFQRKTELPSKKCRKKFTVCNKCGIHCRPSVEIIRICNIYRFTGLSVKICYKDRLWLFPSMGALELMSMGICYKDNLTITAEGFGADQCIKSLSRAFKNGFGIRY